MDLAQISSGLIHILTIAVLNSEELNNSTISNDERLPYYVIPVHYSIQLSYLNSSIYEYYDRFKFTLEKMFMKYDDSGLFRGETSTTINILQSTQYIRLHQLKLSVDHNNVTLITKNGIIYVLNKYKYIYQTNIIEFSFLYKLLPGLYTFKIQFFNNPIKNEENSFYKIFQKYTAHYRNFITLSNMPIKEHSTNYNLSKDKEIWTHFYTTPPMSTLQIAIVMMTKRHSNKINENITLWCDCNLEHPSLEFTREIINNITFHLKSEFCEINIPKMDHIIIPNFPQDGTSKWGIIFHTKSNLIYDEILDSFNNSEILDLFIIQNQYESLHLDSHFNMNPVEITSPSEINSIFSFLRYIKTIIEKFRKLLEKPLKTLGYEEQLMENDFTKCLRQEIVKWACTLQYDECERSALRKLEHHLYNHESRPLLSWWKHWTYCNGLRIANSSVWSDVTDFLLKKHDRKLLSFLPCSEYGAFTSLSFFELFTEDERKDIIRLSIDIFHSIIMKHSNTYVVLEKIFTYLEAIIPK
ncbi:AMPN Aminopeptidase, partial [Acromyrmex insinuator]